jgi:hypothetical protein
VDGIIVDASELNSNDRAQFTEAITMPIPNAKTYLYRIDPPNGEISKGNQKHIHIYKRKSELFAINVDGSAHDGCHGVQIPKKVIPFLQSKGFPVPKDRIIEFFQFRDSKLLVEELKCEFEYEIRSLKKNLLDRLKDVDSFIIIESNIPKNLLGMHSKIVWKYHSLENLGLIYDEHFDKSRDILIECLSEYVCFKGFEPILDSHIDNPHRLYIACNYK